MDKVKKFLEGYIEWLALALAVAFLGWTVWGYVLSKPVKVAVGDNAEVEPGDVAEKVWDGPGKQVDTEIKRTDAPPAMTPQVDYPTQIVSRFSEVPSDVTQVYARHWVPPQRAIDDSVETIKGPSGGDKGAVTQLPVVPAPTQLQFSIGHSNIQPPQNGQNQPAQTVMSLDRNWITFQATLPVKLLADAFDAAKIPDKFTPVAIYRVIAVRQEKDASGNWGGDTEIQPLEMNELMALPKVDCDFQARQDYKTWAETQSSVVLIAEPPFYTVVHGSIWYEPGTKDPNQIESTVMVEPFDPRNPLAFKGDPNSLLPDEKKIYDKAKVEQARKEAAAAAAASRARQPIPSTPPGGQQGGGGAGGGRRGIPTGGPPGGPNGILQPPRGARGLPPGFQGMPQQPGNYGNNGMVDNSAAATTSALPQGSFSPKDRLVAANAAGNDPDIKIWVHDATVQAGKTYRYKMRYIISNPVAGTTNLCNPPTLAQQAYIVSEDSKWSDPISVESDTNFYAVDNEHGIRFDIFKWKNGVWQKQTVQANPGDRIGMLQTTGTVKTDFDTGWTLVDVREDPAGNTKNKILVLVSDTGTVKEKEISLDRQNAEYHKLLLEVQTATASR